MVGYDEKILSAWEGERKERWLQSFAVICRNPKAHLSAGIGFESHCFGKGDGRRHFSFRSFGINMLSI